VDPALSITGQPYVFTGDDPLNATDPTGSMVDQGPGEPIAGVSASSAVIADKIDVTEAENGTSDNGAAYNAKANSGPISPWIAYPALASDCWSRVWTTAPTKGSSRRKVARMQPPQEQDRSTRGACPSTLRRPLTVRWTITNNIERRAAEQFGGRGIEIDPVPGLENLSRADARAVEQVLIEENGGPGGGQLQNSINSIARSNPIYQQSIERGCEILKTVGYSASTVCG
jgi:hypothetical protein